MDGVSFDLTKHLKNISGKQYLEAAARIAAFDDLYPGGTITNEIIKKELRTNVIRNDNGEVTRFDDTSYAIVKASVDTGEGRSATGHKLGAMADDGLEKLLTGAMARGIRHVGINTKEVVTRLLKGQTQTKANELLETISKGQDSYDYVNVDGRLLLLMQKHKEFTIETEILDMDLEREFAKLAFDKNIGRKRWFTAYGWVCFRALITLPGGAIREGIASSNGLALPGYHFFTKGETRSIGRALAAKGLNTFDAMFAEDEDDIADSPVYYEGVDFPEGGEPPDERAQPEVPVAAPVAEAPVQEEARLLSNEECMNALTAIKPQLSDLEFALMIKMRDDLINGDHTLWSNEDWNYALSLGNQFLEWKKEGKPTPKERDALLAPYKNFHGGPILEQLAGRLIAKKRLEQLSNLEIQYLLFKLNQYDFFCRLACYIDYAEGMSYPTLLNEFGLESPLEFIYKKQVLESKYVSRLYELREKLDPKFYEYYSPEDVPAFFAAYGCGIEDPQEPVTDVA